MGVEEESEEDDEPEDQQPVATSWEDEESEEDDELEEASDGALVDCEVDGHVAVPQKGQLAQFCQAMGPQFNFEFVARHLGTDFDAIVERASDVHALDPLVQAGLKPLLRNKFCK